MKVLVTGGLGFIGTKLVSELEGRGHETWACDLFNSHRDHYRRCDVREFRQLEKLVGGHKFDLVYHAAAEYGRWNGEDSAEVYGDYPETMRENVMDEVPIKQMNDYAMTKWVNEMQVLNSTSMFDTETVRIRLFNVYGPGEHYTPYRGVVPTFIYKALHDLPYTVYRGHKRTFEYVNDVCTTLANLTEYFKPGEAYNLGSDNQYEIKHVSDIVIQELGKDDMNVTYKDAEPFTTGVKRGDSSKAKRDLRHRCETSLEEGIRRTVIWMEEASPARKKEALTIVE